MQLWETVQLIFVGYKIWCVCMESYGIMLPGTVATVNNIVCQNNMYLFFSFPWFGVLCHILFQNKCISVLSLDWMIHIIFDTTGDPVIHCNSIITRSSGSTGKKGTSLLNCISTIASWTAQGCFMNSTRMLHEQHQDALRNWKRIPFW